MCSSSTQNRLLSKLADVREVREGLERRTATYIDVREDSSTEPTNKFPTTVEFRKKSNPRFWAIIPAAGIGKRFGTQIPKQYLALQGKPVIAHSISCLVTHPLIHKTVIVIAADDAHWPSIQDTFPAEKITTTVGGAERHISVYQGLLALQKKAAPDDWVLVHDAVRPCLQHFEIDRLISTLKHHPVGGLLGIRARDTLKRTDKENVVMSTLNREEIWQAQTPQMFRYGLLASALKAAIEKNQFVTDEASAIELLGKQPLMVEGSAYNFKITCPEDLPHAALLLQAF